MTTPAHIFRAYDIRGVVGVDIDQDLATQLGKALGSLTIRSGHDCICVGYDGRHSSPSLAESLCAGAQTTGVRVINIGLVPTPLLYFSTVYCQSQCGVMITGSHNPPDYNGFKIMIAGYALALNDIQNIRTQIDGDDYLQGEGTIESRDIHQDYLDAIANQHQSTVPKRIVIDAGNGATSEIAPILFERLGYQVIPLYCEIDGDFPNHHPDPGKLQNMRDLQQAVAEYQADIGLAFDGDGDRLGIVTDTGDIIFPDKLMMLFAEDMLSRHPRRNGHS